MKKTKEFRILCKKCVHAFMRFPKGKKIHNTAFRKNKMRNKAAMFKCLVALRREINSNAKSGRFLYYRSISEREELGFEHFVVFRWMRRYSGLDVEITEHVDEIFSLNERYVGRMEIMIRW